MKTKQDPRHAKRRKIVQELFAESFAHQSNLDEATKDILSIKENLDDEIQKNAPQWPIDKLNKVDLAILRLAVYEIMKKTAPPKVIIDEAIELAKELGAESSPAFVNGVLGSVYNIEEVNENGKNS